MRIRLAVPILVLFPLLHPTASHAQWQYQGVPVSSAAAEQRPNAVCNDGAGGAVVTWQDNRNGTDWNIYVQRMDAAGVSQWTADGVALCTAPAQQAHPVIIPDGSGGAIVVWEDLRNPDADIYAQRVDAAGAVQWAADGVALSAGSGHQTQPRIISDGAGGAIVVWQTGTIPNIDVYAQRIDASGAVQWIANGVALSTAPGIQGYAAMVSDGSGGAIVAWHDQQSGGTGYDIFAQRIDFSGVVQWAVNGVALCAAIGDQSLPEIASDGSGGAIVAWNDPRSGDIDIYAQRVDALGAVQWTADGVALAVVALDQVLPHIAADGVGGAIVTWVDNRIASEYHVYAQRIDASGAIQWTANGRSLTNEASVGGSGRIVADGIGGAIVTWTDVRNPQFDIYAQRIDASGFTQWTINGVALTTAPGFQGSPLIISDGGDGAIVIWDDERSDLSDVYAQHVDGNGSLTAVGPGGSPPALTLRDPYPNPFSTAATIEFELTSRASVTVEVFDVRGRRVAFRSYAEMDEGWQSVRLSALDQAGHALPGGVYFVRIHAQGARVTRKLVIMR